MSRCLQQSPWQVRNKPVCVALMGFSLLQCTGKVGDKVRNKFPTKSRTCRGHKSWKSATWFVSRTSMICVRDKSATLSGTCRGLCRRVGVMEFGLKRAEIIIAMKASAVVILCNFYACTKRRKWIKPKRIAVLHCTRLVGLHFAK